MLTVIVYLILVSTDNEHKIQPINIWKTSEQYVYQRNTAKSTNQATCINNHVITTINVNSQANK